MISATRYPILFNYRDSMPSNLQALEVSAVVSFILPSYSRSKMPATLRHRGNPFIFHCMKVGMATVVLFGEIFFGIFLRLQAYDK